MTREETYGLGAGGRFRVELPFARFPWGDWSIVEAEPAARIVLAGRSGKFNRIRTLVLLELRDAQRGTRVEVTVRTYPSADRQLPRVARPAPRDEARLARRCARLRSILEEDRDRGPRATIAGGPRKPATGLRV